MKTAVIYARYSTDNQNPQSVEDQINYCQDHIDKLGEIDVISIFCDRGISGTNANRDGLNSMIEYLSSRNKLDYVVTESLDRLSRDPEHTHRMYKIFNYFGVEIMSVNEGIINPLYIALKGTMNWMYTREIAEKVIRSHRSRAKEGRLPGGKAYGYKVKMDAVDAQGKRLNGVREIVEEQAAIIRRIFEMYSDGAGTKAIAQRLNLEGIPSPSGGRWTNSSILGTRSRGSGILCNNLYRGKLVYDRIQKASNPLTHKRSDLVKSEEEWVITEVPHLRIVPDELWNRVQARIFEPKETFEKPPKEQSRSQSSKHLSGLVVCGVCGANCQRANGTRYVCGAYRSYRTCKNARGIKGHVIIDELYCALEKYVHSVDFCLPFATCFENDAKKIEAGHAELQKIDKSIEHFKAVISQGITLTAITDGLQELQSKRSSVVARTQATLPRVDDNKVIVGKIWKVLEEMREEYHSESFAPSWRAAMSLIVERIVTTPIPDTKRGMTIDVKIAPMAGWAEFYKRLTSKNTTLDRR